MTNKKPFKDILKEAIVIGLLFGLVMGFIINVFMTHKCVCYGDNQIYMTTMFKFREMGCEKQCRHFSIKQDIEMTHEEPEEIKKKKTPYWKDINLSLE